MYTHLSNASFIIPRIAVVIGLGATVAIAGFAAPAVAGEVPAKTHLEASIASKPLPQHLIEFLEKIRIGIPLRRHLAERGLALLKDTIYSELDIASRTKLEALKRDFEHFIELDKLRERLATAEKKLVEQEIDKLNKRISDLEAEVKRLAATIAKLATN